MYKIVDAECELYHCVVRQSSPLVGAALLTHDASQQRHANLQKYVNPGVALHTEFDVTHEKSIAHLPEIHRPTRIEVHFWINFYLRDVHQSETQGEEKPKTETDR